MDLNEAISFVRSHHRTILATTRADGHPQLSPVVAGVNASGQILVSTRESAKKAINLRARPWATLCVFSDAFFGPWVQLEGPCTIVPLPEAMEGLIEYYRSVSGEHENWDDYRSAMTQEHHVLLRIDVQRAGPSGG